MTSTGCRRANALKFSARSNGCNTDCTVTSSACTKPRPRIACAWAIIASCLTWRVVLLWFAGSAIVKMFMTKTVQQTVVRSISRKREQIATLREELEDLNDYLDLVEARVRDEGKPRLTHDAVRKRYGLK